MRKEPNDEYMFDIPQACVIWVSEEGGPPLRLRFSIVLPPRRGNE